MKEPLRAKLIALLMVFSLALCGCSKEEAKEEISKFSGAAKEQYFKLTDNMVKQGEEELDITVKDNSTLKFVVTRHAMADNGHYLLSFDITNKQATPLLVQVDKAEIDGVSANLDMSITLEPGEKISTELDTLLGFQETEDDKHEVHFHIILSDVKTGEEIFRHGYVININDDSTILNARNRLLYVEVTVPADLYKQEETREIYEALFHNEEYFTKIEELENGDKLYRMTHEQYREYFEKLKQGIFQGLSDLAKDEKYLRMFPSFEYDEELTHFVVKSNYDYYTPDESIFALLLTFYARLYHSFSLKTYDDTTVDFVYGSASEPYFTYHTNKIYNDFG